MATIIFYQKPGCATNARQIQALKSAGHDVVVQDILNLQVLTLEQSQSGEAV